MIGKKICLITFSNNADHQNVIYSMYDALKDKEDVYTIGIVNPKSIIAPHTNKNYYVDCPERPGITKNTFNLKELRKIAKIIKQNNIDILYFESQHIWNAMLMVMCHKCKKVVAVHDVLPHDGNKAMDLSNYVTCHQANRIVLRNNKYKELLAKRYRISTDKISCIPPWRYYPSEDKPSFSKKFLFFGRIRRYKGLDLLKTIIDYTPDVYYQIVGEPDDESLEIVEQIKKLPNATVNDKEVSDTEMRSYFHNADWIVLPYAEGTQSGVIADASSFSRPVIAFDVGAFSEQIDDGVTGFLIAKGDTKAFAEKVLSVKDFDNDKFTEFCHNAYLTGKKHHSATSAAPKLLEVLNLLY